MSIKKGAIFLFGEAEKGAKGNPTLCISILQLFETFGHPPEDSKGIEYAIQFLNYGREILFFRISQEGFYPEDYFQGLMLLKKKEIPLKIAALCLPGVGDADILNAATPACKIYKTFLILSEKDLYDYCTDLNLSH